MGRPKANGEVPTLRATASDTAGPPAFAIVMMNAVGGTSIHWTGQAWRFVPYNFRERSETVRRYGAGAIPEGVGLADWPLAYNELAPFYETVERAHGISGQAGNLRRGRDRRGNRFEGRRRAVPAAAASALRVDGADVRRRRAARVEPVPRARGHPVGGLPRPAGDARLPRLLHVQRLPRERQGVGDVTTIPLAEQRRNFKILTRARVTRILHGPRRARPRVSSCAAARRSLQPAEAVILSTYV